MKLFGDVGTLCLAFPFEQLSVGRQVKNLLNPQWKHGMDIDVGEDTGSNDWNVAVHLVPQCVVLYPLSYSFWKALSFFVAICWKMKSTAKLAQLRNHLFGEAEAIEHPSSLTSRHRIDL